MSDQKPDSPFQQKGMPSSGHLEVVVLRIMKVSWSNVGRILATHCIGELLSTSIGKDDPYFLGVGWKNVDQISLPIDIA